MTNPSHLSSPLTHYALRITLLSLCLAAAPLPAADWMQFRGPHGNGVSDETDAPTVLDAKSIAWAADLPGRGLSSPIIIGDRVIVTCSSGPQQERLHVLCFNASDGSKRWERQFWATGRTMTQTKTCVAAPTPASDGRRIFALFSSNDLICLDLDGNLLWLRGLTRDYPNASNSIGLSSSPVVIGDTVIVQVETDCDSFVAGIDTATGVNRWKTERPHNRNWSSPVVFADKPGRQVVAVQGLGGVVTILPTTGEVLWNRTNESANISSPTPGDGVLYVAARAIVALQADSDSHTPKELWRNHLLAPGTPSPVVQGDRIFTLAGGGKLCCGKTATGERLWSLQLKGAFSSSPVLAAGKLYTASEKGVVRIVDVTKPEGGQIISELDLAQTILCTPAIANGALYIRSDAKLWKFGKPAAR
ncbi:MAG: PQQ-binding-like beta-propeller repeat protein [Verrucomicrobia bacterium]|nr:PQQ-binding-like beta-propeller repeat protein [Verrucomicrobiota bacterium]